jgi:hypothetical protein
LGSKYFHVDLALRGDGAFEDHDALHVGLLWPPEGVEQAVRRLAAEGTQSRRPDARAEV